MRRRHLGLVRIDFVLRRHFSFFFLSLFLFLSRYVEVALFKVV